MSDVIPGGSVSDPVQSGPIKDPSGLSPHQLMRLRIRRLAEAGIVLLCPLCAVMTPDLETHEQWHLSRGEVVSDVDN